MSLLSRALIQDPNKDFSLVLVSPAATRQVRVHVTVLRAMSPWFQRFLTGRYALWVKWVVPDIDAVCELLHFMYTDSLMVVSREHAPLVVQMARRLWMPEVANRVAHHFKVHVTDFKIPLPQVALPQTALPTEGLPTQEPELTVTTPSPPERRFTRSQQRRTRSGQVFGH